MLSRVSVYLFHLNQNDLWVQNLIWELWFLATDLWHHFLPFFIALFSVASVLDCIFRQFKPISGGRRDRWSALCYRLNLCCTFTQRFSVFYVSAFPTHTWEITFKFLWASSFFPLEKIGFYYLPPTVQDGWAWMWENSTELKINVLGLKQSAFKH